MMCPSVGVSRGQIGLAFLFPLFFFSHFFLSPCLHHHHSLCHSPTRTNTQVHGHTRTLAVPTSFQNSFHRSSCWPQSSRSMSDQTPSPFSQFCFFKSLSYSLFEDDWINMVESWQSMVAVNAPMHEFAFNLVPFFANAPRLLPVFHRYLSFAEKDQDFLATMTTVLMSTPLLIKVQHILHSTDLFSAYVVALKLDKPSASHTEVMQSLQTFLSGLPEPTRLEILRVFAEEEASDSMGLSISTLDTALQLLHADTQLYIDILSTLQLNQTQNLPWDAIVSKIKDLVLANKPHAWAGVEQFLQSLHWGSQQESSASTAQEEEEENDDIVEMIEGVDYYPDEEDEQEIGSFPEGEEYDQHYAAFLQDVQDIQSGREVMHDFTKLSVADSRLIVESC